MNTILDIKNLNFSIGKPPEQSLLLSDISFDISRGEVLGLVGESGSGKSMTLRCILRLVEMYPYNTITGDIVYHAIDEDAIDIVSASESEIIGYRRNEVGIIFQQSAQVLNPSISIGDQINERVSLRYRMGRTLDNKDRVIALLDEVLLSPAVDFCDRYPHELSGGQLQRALIAMALANDPRLLLADEPTFNLDKATENEIIDLLLSIKKDRELSILFVSHDMDLVDRFCDRYITISNGMIINADSRGELSEVVPPICVSEDDHQPIVILRYINKAYKKSTALWKAEQSQAVLEDYNLNINKGIITGLVGPSGCGKSTVAKIIAGIDYEYDGEYLLNGENVRAFRKSDLNQMRRSIQIIFQDSYSAMPPHMPVIDLFDHVISAHKLDYSRAQIIELLSDVGLEEGLLDRLPHQLSGGQRQRLLIAKALIVQPDLLICDEIVSSLDDKNKASVIDILRQINVNQGLTILFISHDKKVVNLLCHKVHQLNAL